MKRRGIATIAKEIKSHKETAQPYNLTFAPTGNMTNEEKAKLEQYLAYHFNLWFESWISPLCEEIEDKFVSNARKS